jgi:DNA-directed RNA polymerase subunit RPC12/RpoP
MPGFTVWYLLMALAVVGGLLLAILVFLLVGIACGSLPALGWGAVMLECPHCGARTPSNLSECTRCGKSFRDEAALKHPIVDAPKLRTHG